MQNIKLHTNEYWEILSDFLFDPYTFKNYKQLSKVTNELLYTDQISSNTYTKLIEFFSFYYIEQNIQKKFNDKLFAWDTRFSNAIEQHWENIN